MCFPEVLHGQFPARVFQQGLEGSLLVLELPLQASEAYMQVICDRYLVGCAAGELFNNAGTDLHGDIGPVKPGQIIKDRLVVDARQFRIAGHQRLVDQVRVEANPVVGCPVLDGCGKALIETVGAGGAGLCRTTRTGTMCLPAVI